MMFGDETVAEIVSGQITAAALDVDADLGFTASSVVVKAGHIPETADFGLGGAIAVHLAKTVGNALIGKNASYYIGNGSVSVESVGRGNYVTVGDASGKRARRSFSVAGIQIPLVPANNFGGSSTGIGAGIAVGLTGVDVTAMIEDGVRFGGSPLQSLVVNAIRARSMWKQRLAQPAARRLCPCWRWLSAAWLPRRIWAALTRRWSFPVNLLCARTAA